MTIFTLISGIVIIVETIEAVGMPSESEGGGASYDIHFGSENVITSHNDSSEGATNKRNELINSIQATTGASKPPGKKASG